MYGNLPDPESGNRRQRQDDLWIEQMAKRIYPEIMNRLCSDLGCNRAELYQVITERLAKKRERPRTNAATVVAAIGAVLTAVAASAFALATDWLKR